MRPGEVIGWPIGKHLLTPPASSLAVLSAHVAVGILRLCVILTAAAWLNMGFLLSDALNAFFPRLFIEVTIEAGRFLF
jgi:hypothetical protein